jgi:hypothetical protein
MWMARNRCSGEYRGEIAFSGMPYLSCTTHLFREVFLLLSRGLDGLNNAG